MKKRCEHTHAPASRYHQKHSKRTIRRAACIASSLGHCESFLDIGCNAGLTSSYLIQTGSAERVTGIELETETVDPCLRSDSRFSLVTCNVVDLQLTEQYDAVFYGAVHHHIVRDYGLATAAHVFRRLALACNGPMFFETGHLGEGSRWAWQRALWTYFHTDEDHYHFLIRSIERHLTGYRVIGKFRIHGTPRWLVRFDMQPSPLTTTIYNMENEDAVPIQTLHTFTRTFGSKNQCLHSVSDQSRDFGIRYLKIRRKDKDLFVKRRTDDSQRDCEEYIIGQQITAHWAVKPIWHDKRDIIFEWIEGHTLINYARKNKTRKKELATALKVIWADASKTMIKLPASIFTSRPIKLGLTDAVDLNPKNFLVVETQGYPTLRVIDFERHALNNRPRNHIHFARMFWISGQPVAALLHYTKGIALTALQMIYAQLHHPEWRIRMRRPPLVTFLIVRIRRQVELFVIRLIPAFTER